MCQALQGYVVNVADIPEGTFVGTILHKSLTYL